jgi:uncharacterized protein (DUF2141 family)
MIKATRINSGIILCLPLIVFFYNSKAQYEKGSSNNLITVMVTVTGFRDNNGQAILNIFNSSVGFPSDFSKVYKSMKGKIVENRITFNVELPAGIYAFGCVHDENFNNKMERNMLGLPKEGAGLSNYATGGYPSYNKAKVNISTNTSLQIKIKYL